MEYKAQMEITAWEKECWVCGVKTGYITTHHTLPKHLKPKKNFLCPVCQECHIKINNHDSTGLVAFAYKLQRSFDELKYMVGNMVANLKARGNDDDKGRN